MENKPKDNASQNIFKERAIMGKRVSHVNLHNEERERNIIT